MSERPWLSVLVPVYNVEPYLAECVESLLRQIDEGVEVLLMDDGSTDGSWDVMQQLAARRPAQFRLLRAEANAGVSVTRNQLLDASRGEWIWWVDPDDFLCDGAMDELRAALARGPELDLVLCDYLVHRSRKTLRQRLRGPRHKRTHRLRPGQVCREPSRLLEGSLRQGQLHVWSKIARRRLWGEDLRFPVLRCFEDAAVVPALLLRSRAAVYVDRAWVAYRVREGSLLAHHDARMSDDMQAATRSWRSLLDKQHPPVDLRARQAAAHFMADMFTGAARFAQAQHDEVGLAGCADQFERDIPCSVDQLFAYLLCQASFKRAWRLWYWLRVCRRNRRQLAHRGAP